MMITMYGFGKVTPQVVGITRDLRVLWALEECELPHQVNGLDDVVIPPKNQSVQK